MLDDDSAFIEEVMVEKAGNALSKQLPAIFWWDLWVQAKQR